MTTRETIQRYFDALAKKNGWESLLADDMVFTRFTSPPKQVAGKAAFLQATNGFYSMIVGMEVRELLVDGERVCALTRYELQPPGGAAAFSSDVAEVFSVQGDSITNFGIYFDSAPYPRPR